jgi:hypothetical protein
VTVNEEIPLPVSNSLLKRPKFLRLKFCTPRFPHWRHFCRPFHIPCCNYPYNTRPWVQTPHLVTQTTITVSPLSLLPCLYYVYLFASAFPSLMRHLRFIDTFWKLSISTSSAAVLSFQSDSLITILLLQVSSRPSKSQQQREESRKSAYLKSQ